MNTIAYVLLFTMLSMLGLGCGDNNTGNKLTCSDVENIWTQNTSAVDAIEKAHHDQQKNDEAKKDEIDNQLKIIAKNCEKFEKVSPMKCTFPLIGEQDVTMQILKSGCEQQLKQLRLIYSK